jgi:O-antigen/teichoic acid export membrane protein
MGRTRRFLHGVSVGYATQALITIVGLWLTPFLLGMLGEAPYGLWLIGTQILAYLLLLDLGIVTLLPREVARGLGSSADPAAATAEVSRIVATTVHVVVRQWPIVAIATTIVWLLLPREWAELRGPLGIVFVVFVATFPLRILQAILTGLQELAFGGITYVTAWAAGIALTVGLVLGGFGLYALAVGWVGQQTLMFAMGAIRLARRHPGVVPRRLAGPAAGEAGLYLRRGAWVSLGQIAQVLIYGSDILLIGMVLGPLATVPFSLTGKLLAVFATQPGVIMQMALPALAEMRTREAPERLATVMNVLSQGMLILSGGIAVTVLAVNRGFIGWWVGSQHYGGMELLLLLVVSMVLRHWNNTATYTMFAFGHEARISITTLADGAVSVAIAALLLTQIGVIGAPIGSIAGVSLVSLPANLRVVSRDLGIQPLALLRPLTPWLWRFGLFAVAAAIIGIYWQPESIVAIAATAIAVAGAYALAMFPLGLRPPVDAYVRPRLETLRSFLARRVPVVSP